MGGLLKHIHSLCAITNPSTNSFKRLVPGFEAAVTVRLCHEQPQRGHPGIPAYAKTPNMRRFELRNPDATCNPYFCYAALLMAGLDGIENKIDPHENGWGPYDVNLYTLSDEEKAKLQGLPTSLDAALDALEADHDYLTKGGVFPKRAPQLHCRQAPGNARPWPPSRIPRNSNATTTCKKLRASIGDRLPAAPPFTRPTPRSAPRGEQRRTIMEQVLLDQIIALRAQLHACAEVSGREVVTKHTLLTFLREHTSLELHELAGGFYAAHREPEGTKPTVALRADYDALATPEGGAAHLCGHDGHAAALCGVALMLEGQSIGHSVFLLFQGTEETGAGAALCCELFDREKVDEIYGAHNLPGFPFGAVSPARAPLPAPAAA